MSGPLVEMRIESVRVHMLSSQHVVILRELERDRYLPIWIGPWEASAIAMRLQGVSPERPLTHDLLVALLDELGATVREVVIADLAEETFRARIRLDLDGRRVEVDSRPSDALALAVRTGARVFAADAVLEQAGVSGEGGHEGGDAGQAPAGSTDEGLAVFRDFVNSLDLGDDPRTGPAGRA
ncbi:MAG: bifunctional nuclease family protein [Chloroflexi bacterium]|nr:bifunctional nuclease family protein [Chloroflexota bacterium]